MEAGTRLRESLGRGDALALLAVDAIREIRSTEGPGSETTRARRAYILRSLKHPDEVRTLRRIYGPAFILIAAYSPREQRIDSLSRRFAESHYEFQSRDFRAEAERIVKRDEAETGRPLGQNVRKVFPEADIFVDASEPERLRTSITRMIELIFNNTFHTPTREEYGMFHAKAAALRSASLQRQVGAAITTSEGDIIAVGTNEVPKSGGGLYWCGDQPDYRDFVHGFEINELAVPLALQYGPVGRVLQLVSSTPATSQTQKQLAPTGGQASPPSTAWFAPVGGVSSQSVMLAYTTQFSRINAVTCESTCLLQRCQSDTKSLLLQFDSSRHHPKSKFLDSSAIGYSQPEASPRRVC